ncbi:MAG TPA: hypothetical protein PLI95_18610, partial [Polyangiaceae bacterium]|nr:hypothetical protein [Polyangiaceae bacterium]
MLADDARERAEYQEEVEHLHRLANATKDLEPKVQILLREAGVLATDLIDLEAAVSRYEEILHHDPKHLQALTELADIEERRDNYQGAAAALEKLLAAATEKDDRIKYAQRLATMYETNLEDVRGAIRSLEVVSAADPDDLVAISKLVELCESVEMWERTAELLARLIEVEGDPAEASGMARRMS